jgi:hypothetical protein
MNVLGRCKDYRSGNEKILNMYRASICPWFNPGRKGDLLVCSNCLAYEWVQNTYRLFTAHIRRF